MGAVLAAVGALASVLLTRWGFDKDPKRFLLALSAGILGRLVLFGAALVYVALRTTMDVTATGVSLLGFYVLLQVLELRYAVRRLKRRQGLS